MANSDRHSADDVRVFDGGEDDEDVEGSRLPLLIVIALFVLAAFSPEMEEGIAALKRWLFAHMYRHPRVMVPIGRAKQVVTDLFGAFWDEPKKMPADWAALCGSPGDATTAGVVRDYIAGMTDRYALSEYARVFRREIELQGG